LQEKKKDTSAAGGGPLPRGKWRKKR